MSLSRHQPSARRRGTMLVFVVILIPVAVMLCLTLLTRQEILLRAAERRQLTLQSRLLAQSALTLFQAPGVVVTSEKPLEGQLEGAGIYRLKMEADSSGQRRLSAEGIAANQSCKAYSRLEAMADSSAPTPRASVQKVATHLEAVEADGAVR